MQSDKKKTNIFLSNDPRCAGDPDTPAPVICKYCGAERYTKGFSLMGIRNCWYREGAEPCTCSEGKAEHERIRAEAEAMEAAKKNAKDNAIMKEKIKNIVGDSGMGERFRHRTFQTFITDTTDNKRVSMTAQEYAGNFDKYIPRRGQPLPERNGFLIIGTKGTGKTHIAAAIANDLLHKGTAVICSSEQNIYGKIKRTYGKYESVSESSIRKIYETVPLLIIDDLGKEKPTEWTLSTLYSIINGRYESAMPLIITTNYDPKNLVTHITPKNFDTTTADTIVDRINEMCRLIVMNGKSWRSR